MARRRLGFHFAFFLTICAAHGFFAVPAHGHDMWLEPSTFRPAAGASVGIGVWIGHAGHAEPFPRSEARFLRFEALGPDATSQPVPGADGTHPAGALHAVRAGTTAVVLTTRPAFSELTAAKFRSYLEEEGLDDIVAMRQANGTSDEPGRELYSRSLKTLVSAGGDGPRDRRVGLPLEIVLRDLEPADDAWRVVAVVLRAGEPVADGLVEIVSLDDGGEPARSLRTDGDGLLSFRLDPGSWMLATVHMTPSESPRAEWRSVWSASTFELPVPGERAEETSATTHPEGGTSP